MSSLPSKFLDHFCVSNKSLLFNDIPIEYTPDWPASARDLPTVSVSFLAISDPVENFVLRSFSITSSLTFVMR